jgi:hypothetical protein
MRHNSALDQAEETGYPECKLASGTDYPVFYFGVWMAIVVHNKDVSPALVAAPSRVLLTFQSVDEP